MDYVSREQIDRANETDLFSYLSRCDPGSLVRISGDTYCTSEHDSLRISNGKWYWFSRGIGGKSALKYLVTVQGYTLPQAVRMIEGCGTIRNIIPESADKRRELELPSREPVPVRVTAYLRSRGIHPDVIRYCVSRGFIYESADRHHNAVFVGYGDDGKAAYAAIRAVSGDFRIDARGSDKSCPFRISADEGSAHLHVFEAAIDLLSHASLERMAGRDWRRDHLLSLGGVAVQRSGSRLPAGMEKYLLKYPEIDTVHLHLDNDAAGRAASASIIEALRGRCAVVDEPPLRGKDVNDYLKLKFGIRTETDKGYER